MRTVKVIPAVLALFLSGCSFVTDVEQLYGHYSLKKPEATVELELRRDMKYTEIIYFSSGQRIETSGPWRLRKMGGDGIVELDGFLAVRETIEPKALKRVDAGLPAEKRFGKTVLVVSDNLELHFVRERK